MSLDPINEVMVASIAQVVAEVLAMTLEHGPADVVLENRAGFLLTPEGNEHVGNVQAPGR